MKFYTRQRRMPSVIIVSLIDILAILLIFVIVTTTFKQPTPQITIKLPESKVASDAPAAAQPPALLTISPEEKIYLDDKELTLAELAVALRTMKETAPERGLAMNADKRAPFGIVVNVIGILNQLGIKSMPTLVEHTAP